MQEWLDRIGLSINPSARPRESILEINPSMHILEYTDAQQQNLLCKDVFSTDHLTLDCELWRACLEEKHGISRDNTRYRVILHEINLLPGKDTRKLNVSIRGLSSQAVLTCNIDKITHKDYCVFHSNLALEFASAFGHLDALSIDAEMVSRLHSGSEYYRLDHHESRAAQFVIARRDDYAREFQWKISYDATRTCYTLHEDTWESLRDSLLENVVRKFVFAERDSFELSISPKSDFGVELLYTIIS